MKVIIAGSRHMVMDKSLVGNAVTLFEALHGRVEVVLSGCCRGIDSAGKAWALGSGYPLEEFPADWKGLGKSAGPRRNHEMAKRADGLILIWNGQSPGSANMLQEAKRQDLKIVQVIYEGPVDEPGMVSP